MKGVELEKADVHDDAQWDVGQEVREAWGLFSEQDIPYAVAYPLEPKLNRFQSERHLRSVLSSISFLRYGRWSRSYGTRHSGGTAQIQQRC